MKASGHDGYVNSLRGAVLETGAVRACKLGVFAPLLYLLECLRESAEIDTVKVVPIMQSKGCKAQPSTDTADANDLKTYGEGNEKPF